MGRPIRHPTFVVGLALLGCAAHSLTVGFPVSLSGPLAADGRSMLNASVLFASVAMAVGVSINVVAVDDRSTAAGVRDATNTLLGQGIDVFIGPYTSDLTAALGNVTEASASPILLVAGGAVATAIFQHSRGAFGVMLPATTVLGLPLQVLHAAGAATALLASEPGSGLRAICSVDVRRFGLVSLSSEVFTVRAGNTTDINELLDVIDRLRPDVVVLCGLFTVTTQTILTAAKRGINAHAWVTSFSLDDPRILTDPLLHSSFMIDATSWAPALPGVAESMPMDSSCLSFAPYGCISAVEFQSAFVAAFGVTPTMTAAGTFAALEVITQSMVAANSTGVSALILQVAQRRFSTAFGTLQFGVNSHQNVGVGFARQIQAGVLQVIAPSSTAASQILYPAPTWQNQACLRAGGCGTHGSCTSAGTCECDTGYSGSKCAAPVGLALFITAGCAIPVLVCVLLWCALRSRWRAIAGEQLAIAQCIAAEASEHERQAVSTAESQAQDYFLRYMCHEIRVPLNAVVLATQELAENPNILVAERSNIGIIVTASNAMATLLNDALNLAKIKAGKLELEVTRFVPRLAIDSALHLFHFQTLAWQVIVDVDAPRVVMGDERKCCQVVANFTSNAIKFTPPAGMIQFRLLGCSATQDPSAIVARLPWIVMPTSAAAASPEGVTTLFNAVGSESPCILLSPKLARTGTSKPPPATAAPGLVLDFEEVTTTESATYSPSAVTESCLLVPAQPRRGSSSAPSSRNVDSGFALFVVEDSGVGINEQDQRKLFQPFQQISAGALQKGNGTGLGLSICKHIVEVSGGRIGCHSEEGRGSRFWFTLPVPSNGCESPGIQHSESVGVTVRSLLGLTGAGELTAQSSRKTPRMLSHVVVVDDTQSNCVLLSRLLTRMGAQRVSSACNGRDALDHVLMHPEWLTADAWFVDRNMPVMGGVELCRALRSQGYAGPIIGITGDAMPADQVEFLAAGCTVVLLKPCSRLTLYSTLVSLGLAGK